jgi:arsenate reductase-like glutaredoxin family protein
MPPTRPPRPLSSPPQGTPAPLQVQVFGFEKDRATRAAIRFFKERRVAIHFVDLSRKPIARGELRRFVDRLGASALLDTTSAAYRDGGLGYLRMDDAELVERLLADVRLLRLPLVRFGNAVSVGLDDVTWKAWLKPDDRAR